MTDAPITLSVVGIWFIVLLPFILWLVLLVRGWTHRGGPGPRR